jgi:hypothetical protein
MSARDRYHSQPVAVTTVSALPGLRFTVRIGPQNTTRFAWTIWISRSTRSSSATSHEVGVLRVQQIVAVDGQGRIGLRDLAVPFRVGASEDGRFRHLHHPGRDTVGDLRDPHLEARHRHRGGGQRGVPPSSVRLAALAR